MRSLPPNGVLGKLGGAPPLFALLLVNCAEGGYHDGMGVPDPISQCLFISRPVGRDKTNLYCSPSDGQEQGCFVLFGDT